MRSLKSNRRDWLVKSMAVRPRAVNDEEDSPRQEWQSDEALMQSFCQGSTQAFEILFERNRNSIHAFLARFVGGRNAEDLTQTTFLSVIRARGRFTKGVRFRPWLCTIAANAARDYLRRHRRERLTCGSESAGASESTREATSSDRGLEQAVQRAIHQLPERQRMAVTLHRFQDLSFAEIAEALDLSESAVKLRAHRGYEKLRVLLRTAWEEK